MTQPSIDGVGHGVPRMLYASDGSKWYAILVDSDGHVKIDVVTSALPTDAATATNQTTMITALQLIDDLRAALGSVATDKLLVASKSGDKIFGFESIVEETKSNLSLAAGTNSLLGTAVPTGKVWKITRVTTRYTGTVPTSLWITVEGLADGIGLLDQKSPVSGQDYGWTGEIYLQAADYVAVTVYGATLNDDLLFNYAGVQMNAP